MNKLTLKTMTKDPNLKIGHYVGEFISPGIGHILKSAGCDYVFFDMEHSGFSFETFKQVVRFFEAAEIPVIVRSPSKDYSVISRLCDSGAEGIMVPMINNAREAKTIIQHMKYAPDGHRGVALGIAHDNFAISTMDVDERLRAGNQRTTFFALIETEEGVEEVEQIASTKDVDCLWVGHFDLSTSLGIPGEFNSRKYQTALKKIIVAAKKYGKSLGRLVTTTEEGFSDREKGFDFCCFSTDTFIFQKALADGIRKIREICR